MSQLVGLRQTRVCPNMVVVQAEAGRDRTVAPSRTLELGLDGEQGHVPHQPGVGEHQVGMISLQKQQSRRG